MNRVRLNRWEQERLEHNDVVSKLKEHQWNFEAYVDGSLVVVEGGKTINPYEQESAGTRSKITGFSARSRQKMIETVCKLDSAARPLFLTLTYPSLWDPDPAVWKVHLDRFWKKLKRKYPMASAIWKLEPQQRGAPHYHLLIFGICYVPYQWVAKTWYDVVGSGDYNHYLAGTRIERIRSDRGVKSYASKKYMGKEIGHFPEFKAVGRWWGIAGRECLPWSKVAAAPIPSDKGVHIKRLARRLLESRGRKFTFQKDGRWIRCIPKRIAVITADPRSWVRVLEWAEGEASARTQGVPF